MKKLYSLLFLLLPLFIYSQTTDLIISKYGEGTSNHKFLEIYNGTGSDIDLSTYAFPNSNNAPDPVGEYEYWNSFTAGAVIAAGDVYVITHGSADATLLAEADQHHTYLSNGDDGFKLVKDWTWNDADSDGDIDAGEATGFTVVDVLGDWEGDPGSGWDVAGVSSATANHTLTRKTSVCSGNTDWASSAGTTTEDSEWVVTGSNEGWDTVGSYTTACVSSTAESLPWSDSFENGLTSWTNTATYPWAVDTGDDYGPGSVTDGASALFYNDYDFSSGETADIVSPELDLTSATAPQLTFDYWDSGGSDTVEVLVNGSVAYTTGSSTSGWEEITVDLTSYVGANATVGFRGTSVWGTSNPHIDNVMVAEAPAATGESLPWSDSFETAGVTEWTNTDSSPWKEGLANSNENPPSAVQDGSSAVYFDDYSYSTGTTATITSPLLDLTSATAPQLTFYYADNAATGNTDTVEVVLGDGTVIYTTPAETTDWELQTVDLTAYVGQSITIGFKGTSVYGYSNPHVDNVMVAEAPETGESLPWSDSFETAGVTEWTNTDSSPWKEGLANSNENPPSAVQDGSSAVYFDDYSYSTGTTATITSPLLDLTSATAPQLTFYYADNAATGNTDTVEVVLGDGTVIYTTPAETTDWELQTVDLTAYVGQSITIGFKGTSVYGYSNPHVDNVMVAEAPTAASADWDVSAANFSDSATVSVTVDNFTVTNDGTGDGHWHYTLDGGSAIMVYDTNDFTLTGLSSGSHTLVAWLTDNAHADLDPAVTETVTWTQTTAPGCSESLSYDYTTGSSGGYNFDVNFTGPDAADLLFTTSVVNAGDEMTVTLGGTTESGYDWVYVTDGAGTVLQAPISGTMGDVAVTSTDGTVNVYLASDSSVTSGPVTFTVTCVTPVTPGIDPGCTDFESGAEGWTVVDAAGNDTDWLLEDTLGNESTYSMGHGYLPSNVAYDDWLVSPAYNTTGLSAPTLSYYEYLNWSGDAGEHNVLYSTDYDGDVTTATWTVINAAIGDDAEDVWVQRSFSIPSAENVVIAFQYAATYGADWNIDDVCIQEDTLSTVDAIVLDMRIYPNPVDGNFVTILSPVNGIKYIQVFDINGRMVIDTAINNNMLDVSSINSGFYMIKVTINGQSKISKLVVR